MTRPPHPHRPSVWPAACASARTQLRAPTTRGVSGARATVAPENPCSASRCLPHNTARLSLLRAAPLLLSRSAGVCVTNEKELLTCHVAHSGKGEERKGRRERRQATMPKCFVACASPALTTCVQASEYRVSARNEDNELIFLPRYLCNTLAIPKAQRHPRVCVTTVRYPRSAGAKG